MGKKITLSHNFGIIRNIWYSLPAQFTAMHQRIDLNIQIFGDAMQFNAKSSCSVKQTLDPSRLTDHMIVYLMTL